MRTRPDPTSPLSYCQAVHEVFGRGARRGVDGEVSLPQAVVCACAYALDGDGMHMRTPKHARAHTHAHVNMS